MESWSLRGVFGCCICSDASLQSSAGLPQSCQQRSQGKRLLKVSDNMKFFLQSIRSPKLTGAMLFAL